MGEVAGRIGGNAEGAATQEEALRSTILGLTKRVEVLEADLATANALLSARERMLEELREFLLTTAHDKVAMVARITQALDE